MPRRPRIDLAGVHHVINRGVNRCNIFKTSHDYEAFLRILDKACSDHSVIIHDYCLMSNHFHLLLETYSDNLSAFMKQLNGNYAIYFNKASRRSGHLWQGRFYSRYVMNDAYFLTLIRYIEQNPLEAGMADRVGEYPHTLVAKIVNGLESIEASKESYVNKVLDRESLEEVLGAQFSDKERETLESLDSKKTQKKLLEEHFISCDSKVDRNRAIKESVDDGYTHGEVATYLELSRSTVSKILHGV